MPSFDIVSDFNFQEVINAVDQANREVGTRFDFKGSNSKFEIENMEITMNSQSSFQLKQMLDILCQRLSKRGINIACLEKQDVELNNVIARQKILLRRGIDNDRAKKIIKIIKEKKIKVQTSTQGEKLRVSGKKRDDLQEIITILKNTNFDLPLQYENFRE
ncbi:MAG: YajQ family cyclic di-GMP-binding protein [Gammaproteobacteria bacterium]|nr:YajQ family cyclic di-GMP-binding protein [Gammaproteobacteria bacterium]|tara:strand:+ start:1445 stop:1927 length:483 start_codon:yes stop_codon:yes gene_type:complete